MTRLEFGYNAGLPEPRPLAYWGARAIAKGSPIEGFDLVWNRQSAKGTARQLRALSEVLDAHLQEAQANLQKISTQAHKRVGQSDDLHIVLVNNEKITIIANPQGSCGYLYLAAWLKEHEQT